jgi:hypothetical protein
MILKIDRLQDLVLNLLNQPSKNSCLNVNEDTNPQRVDAGSNEPPIDKIDRNETARETKTASTQYRGIKKKKKSQTDGSNLCRCSNNQMTDASTQTMTLEPEAPSLGLKNEKNDNDIKKNRQKKKKTGKKSEVSKTHSTVPGQPATTTGESCENTIKQLQRLIKSAKCRENSIDNALAASEPDTTLNSDKHAQAANPADQEHELSNSAVERLKQLVSASRNYESSTDRNTDQLQNPVTRNAEGSPNIILNSDQRENTERECETGDNQPNPDTQRSVSQSHAYPNSGATRNLMSNAYSKKKVLLISDDYHSNFDSERFSRRYDVKKVYYKKIEDARRNDDVLSKIRSHRPEIVFIHIGVNDVMQKNRKPFRVFKENFSSLIKTVLENTNCKICFSQMIPIPGKPNLNTNISFANKCIDNLIAEMRQRNYAENRLCTIRNDQLGSYIERYVNEHGEAFRLSARGQAKLWLRFRDALNRTSVLRGSNQHNFDRSSTHDE